MKLRIIVSEAKILWVAERTGFISISLYGNLKDVLGALSVFLSTTQKLHSAEKLQLCTLMNNLKADPEFSREVKYNRS